MKKGYWKNEDIWVCPNHIPPVQIHRNCGRCFYNNCNNERPALKNHKPTLYFVKDICEYHKCNKKKLPNRKYCSDKCRKDKARYNYKLRKQKEKLANVV